MILTAIRELLGAVEEDLRQRKLGGILRRTHPVVSFPCVLRLSSVYSMGLRVAC